VADVPLSAQLIILAVLLGLSAFFSISETAMMASNRFRLRHLAQSGNHAAEKAVALLNQTDKMLGVILLGNNLVNAAAATLVSVIAIELFGEEKWALAAGTLIVTFAILVFSEITPKIVGATYADRLALILAHALTPLLRLFYPLVWFINLFASALLHLLRLSPKPSADTARLSPEELRSLVLESSQLMPHKHRSILTSLFDLDNIMVEDVMTPRGKIEILDIDLRWDEIRAQLATSHHSRLPVCHGSLDQPLGILPLRRLLRRIGSGELHKAALLAQMQPAYYIPAGTGVFSQLAFFQENRQRIGFVVDEYGEIVGLLTLEDIIEEFVGEFTTSRGGLGQSLTWNDLGSAIVEGSRNLCDINRILGLQFPLDGPKTLNGLILEHFQDIPDAGVSIRLAGVAIEILKAQDRNVVAVRIFRPASH
jgi:Mg2+/Co2+ transporter CorB